MKWVFVGQNILGGLTLASMVSSGHYPQLVITRQRNNYENLVLDVSIHHGLPCVTTARINTDTPLIHHLTSDITPDVAFCCSWGDRIREPLLSLPRIGWVNFHPSYLPEYRGPRPIEWQLINGESLGGCTAHFMSEHFDEGPILQQRRIRIDLNDNGETMRVKCGMVLGKLANECYELLAQNPKKYGFPQNEANASYAPPREGARRIDLTCTAIRIYNLVRGLAPFPAC